MNRGRSDNRFRRSRHQPVQPPSPSPESERRSDARKSGSGKRISVFGRLGLPKDTQPQHRNTHKEGTQWSRTRPHQGAVSGEQWRYGQQTRNLKRPQVPYGRRPMLDSRLQRSPDRTFRNNGNRRAVITAAAAAGSEAKSPPRSYTTSNAVSPAEPSKRRKRESTSVGRESDRDSKRSNSASVVRSAVVVSKSRRQADLEDGKRCETANHDSDKCVEQKIRREKLSPDPTDYVFERDSAQELERKRDMLKRSLELLEKSDSNEMDAMLSKVSQGGQISSSVFASPKKQSNQMSSRPDVKPAEDTNFPSKAVSVSGEDKRGCDDRNKNSRVDSARPPDNRRFLTTTRFDHEDDLASRRRGEQQHFNARHDNGSKHRHVEERVYRTAVATRVQRDRGNYDVAARRRSTSREIMSSASKRDATSPRGVKRARDDGDSMRRNALPMRRAYNENRRVMPPMRTVHQNEPRNNRPVLNRRAVQGRRPLQNFGKRDNYAARFGAGDFSSKSAARPAMRQTGPLPKPLLGGRLHQQIIQRRRVQRSTTIRGGPAAPVRRPVQQRRFGAASRSSMPSDDRRPDKLFFRRRMASPGFGKSASTSKEPPHKRSKVHLANDSRPKCDLKMDSDKNPRKFDRVDMDHRNPGKHKNKDDEEKPLALTAKPDRSEPKKASSVVDGRGKARTRSPSIKSTGKKTHKHSSSVTSPTVGHRVDVKIETRLAENDDQQEEELERKAVPSPPKQELEPISDEEDDPTQAGDGMRVDWSALDSSVSAECKTSSSADPLTAKKLPLERFKLENFLPTLHLEPDLLDDELVARLEQVVRLRKKSDQWQLRGVAVRGQPSVGSSFDATLLSARTELKLRRRLCGLQPEPPSPLLIHCAELGIPYNEESCNMAEQLYLNAQHRTLFNKLTINC